MIKLITFGTVLAVCLSIGTAQFRTKLPTYIKPCSKSSPNINQCIVDNANFAIPKIVNGNFMLNVPIMQPLVLREVVVRKDHILRCVLRNVRVYGLEQTKMTDAKIDFNQNVLDYTLANPKITIIGDYVMKGQLLDMDVDGAGVANITLVRGRYTQGLKFTFDDQLYASITNSHLSYKTDRNIYQFNALAKQNDFLGYQSNVYLNNNWREVSRFFQKDVSKYMNDFLADLFQKIAFIVPLDEVFVP
ncbi:uncharacterized protein CBL_08051 [Carabus blaptoides fortunei]